MNSDFTNIISGDSHVMEPSEIWNEALGDKWGDEVPRSIDEHLGKKGNYYYSGAQVLTIGRSDEEAKKIGFQAAGWDPAVRVEFQDKAGIRGEMMNATRMLLIMQHPNAGVLRDCAAVFNDWLAEFCSHAPDRLYGVSMIPMSDVDWSVAELERTVKKGLRVANVQLIAHEGAPPYRNPYWDPFWARCEEMDVPVQLHSITGRIPDPLHFHTPEEQENSPQVLLELLTEVMGVAANEFIWGKVLDRFKNLKMIVSEFELSWLPHYMWRLDQMQEAFAARIPLPTLDMRASDYIKHRMWHGMTDDALGATTIPKVGFDRVIWGSDFPHIRSIGLDTQSRVGQMFAGFSPEDQAKLVGGNAIDAYNLPH